MDQTIINGIIAVIGILIANYGIKLGRAYKIIKAGFDYIEAYIEAKKDGTLTQKEKAALFDYLDEIVKQAWSILKGLFPNKSK